MDNVCHTLVGAAFGQAGLNRRTRFGQATLIIAANLPDVDVLAFAASTPAVALRRGWTHGIAAQALLPIALTAVMLLVARIRATEDNSSGVSARWLLVLSYIGVLSHVYLDLLNNYGVRLLAPLDWRWFYGDAVFILDPWIWLALGGGVWLSARRSARGVPDVATPARVGLVVAAAYIAAMCVTARTARAHILDGWRSDRGRPPQALMVGPIPISPFHRQVIVDAGDHYETGTFTWPTNTTFDPIVVPKNDNDPRVARAREAPRIRGFLVWSRFPYWTFEPVRGGTRVIVEDMRFGGRGAGFTQSVVVQ